MSAAAVTAMVRRLARRSTTTTVSSSSSSRGFRTSAAARGNPGDPEYIHAKEMYAIRDISSPKLIYGMGIAGGVAFGVSIPIFAVNFQQAKGG
mmetsp:Transcript_2792/g.8604  ORF Transcript_2792/g.8604 Transcript_2792/m.8604 type:complete len:93 (+) Transcript_2792:92-370(+)